MSNSLTGAQMRRLPFQHMLCCVLVLQRRAWIRFGALHHYDWRGPPSFNRQCASTYVYGQINCLQHVLTLPGTAELADVQRDTLDGLRQNWYC